MKKSLLLLAIAAILPALGVAAPGSNFDVDTYIACSSRSTVAYVGAKEVLTTGKSLKAILGEEAYKAQDENSRMLFEFASNLMKDAFKTRDDKSVKTLTDFMTGVCYASVKGVPK